MKIEYDPERDHRSFGSKRAQYLAGNPEDSKDFVEWSGDYQHYISLKQKLERRLTVVACGENNE